MSVATFDSTNNHDCIEYIPVPAEYDTLVKRAQELANQLPGHDTKQGFVLQIPAKYETLVKRAHELVKQIAGQNTKQAMVLQTTDNQIHEAIIDAPYDADETILHAIGKDNAVIRIVCCWSDGGFDLPSYDFRKKLCDFNPNNRDAEMLLIGDRTFIVKSIRVTMPKV